MWINIADQIFDIDYSTSPTCYFINSVLPHYGHALVLRRDFSTTVVFSSQSPELWVPELKELITHHPDFWPKSLIRVSDLPDPTLSKWTGSLALLTFTEQAARLGMVIFNRPGHFGECLALVQQLSDFDLIRLSRARSHILGERQ